VKDIKSVSLHGVLMQIFNQGCLIIGESQSGKSELALSLLDRGHTLVADDAVDIFSCKDNMIHGRSHKLLKELLEVRHLGVINVKDHFGPHAVTDTTRLDLMIKLKDDLHTEVDRLSPMMTTHNLLGTDFVAYELYANSARHLPILIETTVREHMLQQSGKNALRELKLAHNQQVRQPS